MAVVDLGSRRRTLLFLRADQLAHFVSCLVYLPARPLHHRRPARDAGHPGPRARRREHRVHRPGQRITLGGSAFHGPAARGLAARDVDVSLDERDPDPGPADRGGAHLGRPADRRGARPGRSTRPRPSTTRRPSPRSTSRPSRPHDAIDDIAIIEELQDDSVKLVFAEGGDDGTAQLTWYLGGRSASLSQLLPMLQSMGVDRARGAAVHRDPARRAAGVDLPVQDLGASATFRRSRKDPNGTPPPTRFADAVTAIWHGRVEIDRFNELVLRAGLTWQQVVDAAHLREVPAAGGFSVQPVPHRDGAQRQPATPRGRWSSCSRRCSIPAADPERDAPRRPRPQPWPPTSTRWSAWTPTACCAHSRR